MAGWGEEAVGSGPPDHRQATPRELFGRWVEGFHERDWGTLRDLLSPQLKGVDRRPIGWGSLDGPDAYIRYVEELVVLAPDVWLSMTPLVWGRRAAVTHVTQRGHLAAGGGEMELGYTVLFLVADGRLTHFEYFEPADYQQALVRFEEIGAQTEPERVYARLCGAVNAHDLEAVADCLGEDYNALDHRVLGWEPMGPDAVVDVYRSWIEVVPDMGVAFEWLGGDDDHIALRWTGHGHATAEMGGGAAEYRLILVATVRHGRIARTERFDLEDERAALARLAELQSPAPDAPAKASAD